MKRKAFTLIELLTTLAISGLFFTLLMQSDMTKYKLLKVKKDMPIYSTTALIGLMQQDFSKYNLITNTDKYLELKQNDTCSVFWNYDIDTNMLERYVDCSVDSCETDCQIIKLPLKDFNIEKENDSNMYVQAQQNNQNYLHYFKIFKNNFILD